MDHDHDGLSIGMNYDFIYFSLMLIGVAVLFRGSGSFATKLLVISAAMFALAIYLPQ